MKTLLTYLIVASMGLMTVDSDPKSGRMDYVAPLESLPLNDEDLITTDHFTVPVMPSGTAAEAPKKKKYHIYFENKSQTPVKAAVRYKEYAGDWKSEGWISLEPGEKKLIGLSDETTYFYYAKLDTRRSKKVWKGKYKFAMSEEASNKLPFKKQEIWECYHTQMCNTFAVFR